METKSGWRRGIEGWRASHGVRVAPYRLLPPTLLVTECRMRFVVAILGILLSLPPLLFFWIGSQTFIRRGEHRLAVAVTIESSALLALSIASLFTPSIQRIQLAVLIATVATVAAVLSFARRRK
jgi:hypothetical protein